MWPVQDAINMEMSVWEVNHMLLFAIGTGVSFTGQQAPNWDVSQRWTALEQKENQNKNFWCQRQMWTFANAQVCVCCSETERKKKAFVEKKQFK